MSRSYKKTAGWTDHKTPRTKEEKRFANGAVRKAKEVFKNDPHSLDSFHDELLSK